jgi:hypothetical protein
MPASRSVVSVLVRELGGLSHTLKAGPAGGRHNRSRDRLLLGELRQRSFSSREYGAFSLTVATAFAILLKHDDCECGGGFP